MIPGKSAVLTAAVILSFACRAQPYENLVLEGGGIRGIAYAGALQVLEAKGVCSSIKRVAGTSVGGLVAALFAVGYSAQEMQGILRDLRVHKFNDGAGIFIGGQQRFRKRYGWYRGDRLESWLADLIRQRTGSAHTTFSQLRILAGSDPHYKQLYLTATDLTGQKGVVFSADSFGDMELKTAVRASMSIPLYFTAVLLDSVGHRFTTAKDCPSCHVFVDGGVVANYPLTMFDSMKNGTRIPNTQTLGLKLERVAQMPVNEQDGHIAPFPIHDISTYIGALYNLCIESLNRTGSFEAEQSRTIYISTSDIRPRVRKISAADKQQLYRNGIAGAEKYFLARSMGKD